MFDYKIEPLNHISERRFEINYIISNRYFGLVNREAKKYKIEINRNLSDRLDVICMEANFQIWSSINNLKKQIEGK